jgi:hypothetical protein
MHITQHTDVKGYVDSFTQTQNEVQIRGWCFHVKHDCPIRVSYELNGNITYINRNTGDEKNKRDDVFQFYKCVYNCLFCGWNFTLLGKDIKNIKVEMFFEYKCMRYIQMYLYI